MERPLHYIVTHGFNPQPVLSLDGESLLDYCVPDESLTVKDIFERFTRGLPLDVTEYPKIYDDLDKPDDDFSVDPRFDGLDLSQLKDLAELTPDQIEFINDLKKVNENESTENSSSETDTDSSSSES